MLGLCIFLPWYRLDIFFPLEKSTIWIEESYFSWKQWFEVKNILIVDLFITNMQLFTLHVNRWICYIVDYCSVWAVLMCQLFELWFWRHPFTAKYPLVSKWCDYHFSKCIHMKKLTHILDGLRVGKFSAYYNFWVKNSSVQQTTASVKMLWNVLYVSYTMSYLPCVIDCKQLFIPIHCIPAKQREVMLLFPSFNDLLLILE